MEQAIRRGSRGRKPAKAVTFDKAERRRRETANNGQVQLRSGLYLLLADFSGCTSLTTCRQRLGSVMISTPGHRVFRGSRSRALPASVPSVGGAVLRRLVALPSPRGDLPLLKPVRRATLPRHCRKSGECRITLSLPSSRSDIHDKSAPTECDPHFRP